jgi:GMP synthase (glutamine-hydrolysing)
MRIHYIIHAEFEKTGVIESWATENGHSFTGTRPFKGERLPHPSQYDLLLIMGGPQSAVEIDKFPFLYDEVSHIREAIQLDKRVIGFCLGAQLISRALGGNPVPSPEKEIGFFPIELTEFAKDDLLLKGMPRRLKVFHWHSDMPGIPEGAIMLAKSEGCPYQAFRFGQRVYGFQFHLEMSQENVLMLIHECAKDLQRKAKYIQKIDEMLKEDFDKVNGYMITILDRVAQRHKLQMKAMGA